MKIEVKVIPKAHNNSIELTDGIYTVRTTSIPEKGKVNKVVVSLLAKYFHVPKNSVKIIHGRTSREKVVEIER